MGANVTVDSLASGGMSQDLQDRLVAIGATVATAESLTGGRLSVHLTELPGSSQTFLGGVVSYATAVKQEVLGVPDSVIHEHGVVSAECARAMAEGVRDLIGATYSLSTTGVAGPEDQEGKPPGKVFLAVAGPGGTHVEEHAFSGDRQEVQEAACEAALSALDGILPREEPALG
jgi:PncC family amidohydrolase